MVVAAAAEEEVAAAAEEEEEEGVGCKQGVRCSCGDATGALVGLGLAPQRTGFCL